MAKKVTLTLEHNTDKELKKGKRVYRDDNSHNIYLQGDEVKKLGEPDKVKVTIEAVEDE